MLVGLWTELFSDSESLSEAASPEGREGERGGGREGSGWGEWEKGRESREGERVGREGKRRFPHMFLLSYLS